MNTSIVILSGLTLLIAVYCLWQTLSFNRLRKNFFSGTNAVDLEEIIRGLETEGQTGKQRQLILEQELAELKDNFQFSVQKLGLVRFNPFQDGGGNFSFSLAILDGRNNGVVITSMHGRQQNRIYTKKVLNGRSDLKLTEEEEQAVILANQNKS